MKNLIVLITLLTCFSSIYTGCSDYIKTRKDEHISEQFPLRFEFVESRFLSEEKRPSSFQTPSIPRKTYYTTTGYIYEIRLLIRISDHSSIFERPFWIMYQTSDRKIETVQLNQECYRLDNDFLNDFRFDIKVKKKGSLKLSLIELDEKTGEFYYVDKHSLFLNREIQLNQE